MKNLLLIIVSLATFVGYSQLYVTPNTSSSTDSYVYVSDEILFVEQDVNLVLNTNNAATVASVYLRDGAQLIQGTTSSNNSGTGLLSVYQNAPDSDRWTYNNWCSPVGNQTLSGSGNVNFGMYRLYDIQSITASNQTGRTTGYDGSISPLTVSSRWTYIHLRGDEVEGDYTRINADDAVTAGLGFFMKGVGVSPNGGVDPLINTGSGFNYDFRGRANNGTMTVQVYYDAINSTGELTLSGNPYPSALDLNRVFWDSDNSELDNFKYWDEDKTKNSHYYSENAGGYGTYIPGSSDPNGETGSGGFQAGLYTPPTFTIHNSGGNTGVGSAMGGIYLRRFAPIGQGFMLVPDNTGDGIIHIKNSHRRYILEGAGTDSQFRNPNEENSEVDTRLPQLRINTNFDESHVRQILLAFSDEATNGFDRGFDGKSPMDAVGAEIYFPISKNVISVEESNTFETFPYVIQTLPFRIEKKIPLTFVINELFNIEMAVVEEIKFSKAAYLWDNIENTFKEITDGNIASLTLDVGTYENRFYIVFNDRSSTFELSEGTILTNEVRENVDFFQNNPVKQLEVRNPEGYTIKQAQIFDISGKLVISERDLGDTSSFTFSTALLSDGVYMVRLTTIENIQVDYKMVVHNK